MIYIEKYDLTISHPTQEVSDIAIKNHIYYNLERGKCIFIIPDDIKNADKKIKRNYKVGFLFDFLGSVYPEKNIMERYHIISDEYQFWFTHRQFWNIYEEYKKDQSKYLLKRSLLCT